MRRRRSGFTLLELLLALGLTVIVAGAMAACLYTAFRAKTTAERAVAVTRATDAAMDVIATDVNNAVVPNGILARPFLGAGDTVALVSAGPEPKATVTGDMKLVEYRTEPGASGGNVLVRRVTANLLSPVDEEPASEVICQRVTAFGLRYFDGSNWVEVWDSTQQNNTLPTAVEVTLELAPAGEGEAGRRVVRVMPMSCGVAVSGLQLGAAR